MRFEKDLFKASWRPYFTYHMPIIAVFNFILTEDSNEVPNQCESSPLVGASSGTASGSGSAVSEETRGTVAGSAAGSGAEAATSSLGQVTSNQQYQARRPTAMPIINRHHVSLVCLCLSLFVCYQ